MKIIVHNSPNHFAGRCGIKADIISCHQTGGNKLTPALNWYMNSASQCCPNYLIDVDGTIHQMVDPDNGAWANGTSSNPSDKKYYGYSLSKIVRDRKVNANYYTYSIEFVHCQWGNITEAQISAAVELIKNVLIPHMKKNGVTPVIDREHIIGHSDITPKIRDPDRYNCPGKQFPYDEIINRVLGKKPATIMSKLSTKKVTLAFVAAVRSAPTINSNRVGTLNPGDTVTIVVDSDVKDRVSNYIYVRIAGQENRWIVRSAIK